jgi:hypothetical protein
MSLTERDWLERFLRLISDMDSNDDPEDYPDAELATLGLALLKATGESNGIHLDATFKHDGGFSGAKDDVQKDGPEVVTCTFEADSVRRQQNTTARLIGEVMRVFLEKFRAEAPGRPPFEVEVRWAGRNLNQRLLGGIVRASRVAVCEIDFDEVSVIAQERIARATEHMRRMLIAEGDDARNEAMKNGGDPPPLRHYSDK